MIHTCNILLLNTTVYNIWTSSRKTGNSSDI